MTESLSKGLGLILGWLKDMMWQTCYPCLNEGLMEDNLLRKKKKGASVVSSNHQKLEGELSS